MGTAPSEAELAHSTLDTPPERRDTGRGGLVHLAADQPRLVGVAGGRGDAVGASGVRQVRELVQQMRGPADERQVPNPPRVGVAQLYGAPGVAAVSVLTT